MFTACILRLKLEAETTLWNSELEIHKKNMIIQKFKSKKPAVWLLL